MKEQMQLPYLLMRQSLTFLVHFSYNSIVEFAKLSFKGTSVWQSPRLFLFISLLREDKLSLYVVVYSLSLLKISISLMEEQEEENLSLSQVCWQNMK